MPHSSLVIWHIGGLLCARRTEANLPGLPWLRRKCTTSPRCCWLAFNRLLAVDHPAWLDQMQVYDEPTVLLARHISGEEEVPVGAVGLIGCAGCCISGIGCKLFKLARRPCTGRCCVPVRCVAQSADASHPVLNPSAHPHSLMVLPALALHAAATRATCCRTCLCGRATCTCCLPPASTPSRWVGRGCKGRVGRLCGWGCRQTVVSAASISRFARLLRHLVGPHAVLCPTALTLGFCMPCHPMSSHPLMIHYYCPPAPQLEEI